MKKNNLLLLVLIIFMSCKNEVKPIGEGILDLEDFDFDTKVSQLYPERLRSKDYTDSYVIKGFKDNESLAQVSVDGSEYLQGGFYSNDSLAKFDNHIFQAVNLVVSADDRIKIINGVASWVNESEVKNMFNLLNEKYGKPKELICSWGNNLKLYEWTLSDKIIRFVSTLDDNSNALNLDLITNRNNKNDKSGEEEPLFSYYFFILNPEFKKDMLEDRFFSGAFLYFKEER
ncbi:hypothetical protein [Cellulophaga sp. HaHa_2_1]|uniref:hypothetical protein n=1 Tax=Cellulophaga sp. HaHa_2_1 TaxID=2749994 RepID=UPI001C4EA2FD|nr:hypothetical protein [Cellulophaga sp. HaHa_2_1]QXP52621.1 hypothetical protein H0I24_01475 [Cellulophaga sp. HaHa_2_1]